MTEATQTPTVHTAVTTGATCQGCTTKIHKGDKIIRVGLGKFVHYNCY